MEILHLLPAALETLFSVYWLNACHFCTVDVNNKKKQHMQKHRPVHTHVNVKYEHNLKALFFAVESTFDL